MEVDNRVDSAEDAVLVPGRLSNAQNKTDRFERWHVVGLIARVPDSEEDVNLRFRREPRHRGRANVLDQTGTIA